MKYKHWVAVVGVIVKGQSAVELEELDWILQTSYSENVGYNGLIYIKDTFDDNYLGLKNNCY